MAEERTILTERIKQLYEPKHYEIVKAKQGYAVMLKGLYSPIYKPLNKEVK